jgi:hypothetical protein
VFGVEGDQIAGVQPGKCSLLEVECTLEKRHQRRSAVDYIARVVQVVEVVRDDRVLIRLGIIGVDQEANVHRIVPFYQTFEPRVAARDLDRPFVLQH